MALTQIDSGLLAGSIPADKLTASAQYNGFKNRIINGAMVIDQRNDGTASTPTANAYVVDRWRFALGGDPSKVTIQQNAGAVTPPAGFTNYIGATVATAVASPNAFRIDQFIEGYNVADLAWGTASAHPVTLSFWVRSSLTGTFGGAVGGLAFEGTTVSYPFTYSISSADTWQYVAITIPGATTGAWLTTTGMGVAVYFSLGEGASYKGTAGTWQSGTYFSATGTVNLINTLGATFYITGVQFEKGSTATSFDNRPYGQELALCQRYAVAFLGGVEANNLWGLFLSGFTSTRGFATVHLPVQMRAAPTVTQTGSTINSLALTQVGTISSITVFQMRTNIVSLDVTGTGITSGAAHLLSLRDTILSAEI